MLIYRTAASNFIQHNVNVVLCPYLVRRSNIKALVHRCCCCDVSDTLASQVVFV